MKGDEDMSTREMQAALLKVKTAMRITAFDFDDEILDLMHAAMVDLGIAGVNGAKAIISDSLIRTAVITYCRMMFGQPDEYERLKRSYDEQKAQLSMASGYTNWGDGNGSQ
jgi:hypothetical protein